jgi:aminoglycoside 2''-phosphotransferase
MRATTPTQRGRVARVSGTNPTRRRDASLLDDKAASDYHRCMASTTVERSQPSTENLATQIRSAFPDLKFSTVRLIQGGEDHTVLLLDETWIFRFPRTSEYRRLLPQEIQLLAELQDRTSIPVPRYEYVSENGDFGGYRIIEGVALSPDRLKDLSETARVHVAEQLGGFLSALHGLPPHLISASRCWHLGDYGRRYRESRRSLIADALESDLLSAVDDLYASFVDMQSPLQTVVHDDLRDAHILVAPSLDRLAGIIDFGDAAIGDPSLDFSYFWAYGDRFFDMVHARYQRESDDGFVARSAHHFARFLVDEVYYFARAGMQPETLAACSLLRKQLLKLGR